jgi:hypothetical protein
MEPARAGRNGQGIHSPSDAAPGLLADVAQTLRAPHAPDRCPGQHALRTAGAAPLAVQQRAAAKAVAQAEELLMRVVEQDAFKATAKTLAEVFQRSSANVAGRNGYLSVRNHQRRGLDPPRKRAGLTAMHNFFLTRADGTTAAERFFGQKPRSMLATILESVEIPPAPLSPPRRALGEAKRV